MKEWRDRLKSDEILSKIGFHENNPFYLETVFRTNTISAYNAGRWEEIQRRKDSIAYLQYIAIDDSRTTEICNALDGTILPADDPFWKPHYPPNHFNCRSQVVEISPEEVEILGYKETDKDKIDEINGVPVPKGFDTPIEASWWNLSDSMADRVNKYGMKESFLDKAKDLCRDKIFTDNEDSLCEDYFKVKNKLDGKKDDNIKMNNDVEKANEIFDKFIENYKSVDKSNIKNTFRNIFENETKYDDHINRRIKFGHIDKNNPEKDYFDKTIDCIKKCDIIMLEKYDNFWQKLYFSKKYNWLVILNANGQIISSYDETNIILNKWLKERKKILGVKQSEVKSEDIRSFKEKLKSL